MSRLVGRGSAWLVRPKQTMASHRTLRIACASGFWGDSSLSTTQLVKCEPQVDYIVSDYLSEITMSLLARAKAHKPDLGYCPDFLAYHMRPNLKAIADRGIKVVTNAGGLNPIACANALQKMADASGVSIRVAAVTGDNLSEHMEYESLIRSSLPNSIDHSKLSSVNAYFGALPIVCALDHGADVVVTGRCVDSALVLAPLMHHYQWNAQQLQHIAVGSLAGHIIECGAQCTGGIFTDWNKVPNWANIGFPIACFDDDSAGEQFTVTKPPGTGGLVSRDTVAEQLIYEIGDPANYLLPDVTLDMSQVQLEQVAENQVLVRNVQGGPAPNSLKVTATYEHGFRCTAVAPVVGPNATAKAQRTAHAILERGLEPFSAQLVHVLGSEQSYNRSVDSREVVLWLAVQHPNHKALQLFAREIASAGTGMAPGLTGLVGGRPTISPVLKHVSFPVDRQMLTAHIHMDGKLIDQVKDEASASSSGTAQTRTQPISNKETSQVQSQGTCRLQELALTRSGDKGDTSNIGVIPRDPRHFEHLKQHLTVSVVQAHFAHLLSPNSQVLRYELPGISGLNFLLTESLGGGGVASVRIDPQGKAYGQMMLDIEIPAPKAKTTEMI